MSLTLASSFDSSWAPAVTKCFEYTQRIMFWLGLSTAPPNSHFNKIESTPQMQDLIVPKSRTSTNLVAIMSSILLLMVMLVRPYPAHAEDVKNGAHKEKDGITKAVEVTEGGVKKGVKETKGGLNKAYKESSGGIGKGWKETKGGVGKGMKETKGGIHKGIKSTKSFLKKVF